MARFKEKNINELPELLQVNIQSLQATENTLERLEEQLRSLKEREGYLQTQLANISPFMENSDRIRLENLGTQLVELQTKFSNAHPDVIKTKSEIVALRKKLAKAYGNRAARPLEPDNPAYVTLASQLASAQSEVLSVTNQIEESKRVRRRYQKRIEKTPAVECEYREITIKQTNLQEKFNDLMGKHMEANVAYGLEQEQKGERFTLIEPPLLPEKPFKPNRLIIALVGVVLGVGAGFGCVVFREWADQSVRNEDKLVEQIGLPVLGSVPALVSVEEYQYTLIKRSLSVVAALAVIIAGVVIFHYYVMDLDVLWAKLGRKLPVM
jgi:succinoglycan biosynthesis transport protein ExoP